MGLSEVCSWKREGTAGIHQWALKPVGFTLVKLQALLKKSQLLAFIYFLTTEKY